ncbi:MAG TPA: cupin domain-containing protein [Candidatus Omnitrophota bacterium]|nr:cupin domain-containing protein [Candidatus Omnitrophota bacterium]
MIKNKAYSVQLKGRQRFLRLFGDSKKVKGLRSGYVILKPKESVGEHTTGSSEEVVFIIHGSGLVYYGKKSCLKVKKNIFVYLPPKMPHNVVNTGKNMLKYIYIAGRV